MLFLLLLVSPRSYDKPTSLLIRSKILEITLHCTQDKKDPLWRKVSWIAPQGPCTEINLSEFWNKQKGEKEKKRENYSLWNKIQKPSVQFQQCFHSLLISLSGHHSISILFFFLSKTRTNCKNFLFSFLPFEFRLFFVLFLGCLWLN